MAFTDRGGGMGASAFYGSSGNPNSQINVQAGPGYSFPGVGGFNLNGIAEKLWQDKEDARRRAQAQQDWENEMRLWQAKQQAAAAEPSETQKRSEKLTLQEQEAALQAKDSVAPKRWVQIGPSGYWADDTDQMTARQRELFMPAGSTFTGQGMTSGAALSPSAPETQEVDPLGNVPQWAKEQVARRRGEELTRSFSAGDQLNALLGGTR